MSLLNRSTDVVTVFPEETFTDTDGNARTRSSAVGVVSRAVVQPISTTEKSDGAGVLTDEKLRLRLVGWHGDELGSGARIDWNGRRYSILGEPSRYNGSRHTAHVTYTMVRSGNAAPPSQLRTVMLGGHDSSGTLSVEP